MKNSCGFLLLILSSPLLCLPFAADEPPSDPPLAQRAARLIEKQLAAGHVLHYVNVWTEPTRKTFTDDIFFSDREEYRAYLLSSAAVSLISTNPALTISSNPEKSPLQSIAFRLTPDFAHYSSLKLIGVSGSSSVFLLVFKPLTNHDVIMGGEKSP